VEELLNSEKNIPESIPHENPKDSGRCKTVQKNKGGNMAKRKRGTCKNCERPDLALSSLGYCGTCKAAYYSADTPGGKKKALADAAARLKGKGKLPRGKKKLLEAIVDCAIELDQLVEAAEKDKDREERAEGTEKDRMAAADEFIDAGGRALAEYGLVKVQIYVDALIRDIKQDRVWPYPIGEAPVCELFAPDYPCNPFQNAYVFTHDDATRVKISKWRYPLLFFLRIRVEVAEGFEFRYKVWGEKVYLMETRKLKEG